MTEPWNRLVTYLEGERCLYEGKLYQARFDLCRGLRPSGLHSEKFWRRVPTIAVPKSPAKKMQKRATDLEQRQAPDFVRGGYITRDFSLETKRRRETRQASK